MWLPRKRRECISPARQRYNPQVARPLRAVLALLALGVGCGTQTIDLLSPPGGPGQSGSSGAPTGGTRAGSPNSSGAGGSGATGGGSAARGGTGFVTGGTGNVASGGASGEGGDNQGGASSVDCVMDDDCPASRQHCVAITGTQRFHCVECIAHANCELGERCNFLTNQCAPACTTFEQCPLTLPFCERGVCIQCQTDSHCGAHVCVFGHCEECRSTLDCPPSAPVCGEIYTCRPCTGMFQCGQYRYCDLTTGRCEPF
jgi:hypothetical protein